MILLAATATFLLTLTMLPIVIRLFKSINLTDSPSARKIHTLTTPSLGGLPVYLSLLIALFIAFPIAEIYSYKFFLAGIILCLILGIWDDISSLHAKQKLPIQILAAYLVTAYSGFKITSLQGLFGIGELPDWLAIGISIFVLVALTNSFNLIDGIDGLAGSICVLVSGILGVWFLQIGNFFLTVFCFSLTSGMVAFLIFNWHPSRIFMGDTGSLVTGFVLTCMIFEFINTSGVNGQFLFGVESSIALGMILFITPIYDTIRVIIRRISSGAHPFTADKLHLHHILIRQGFTHSQATLMLVGFNTLLVIEVQLLDHLGDIIILNFNLILMIMFGTVWDIRLKIYLKRKKQSI